MHDRQASICIRIAERHGVARQGEPLRIGVPIARGWLQDAAQVQLQDEQGRAVPGQFKPLARWSDHTIKWLLVDALVSAAPNQQTCLYLSRERAAADALKALLRVQDFENRIEVDTGAARFHVRKGGPSPIGAVLIGGSAILDASGVRVRLLGSRDEPWQVEIEGARIEEQGVIRTSIVCEARAKGRNRKGLRLKFRCIFVAGSPVARMECEVWNPRAARHAGGVWDLGDAGSVLFNDFSLELRPAGAVQGLAWQSNDWQWHVRDHAPWSLYQDSSGGERWNSPNHLGRKGRLTVDFRGFRVRDASGHTVDQGERATPGVIVDTQGGWVCASVENFWQNFPKALRWSRPVLSVGLFPSESSDCFELQGGEKKRHSVFLEFGVGAARPRLHELRAPLEASLDPGQVARSGAVNYLIPESEDPNRGYLDYVASIIEGPHSFMAKRELIDEYGWRNFGDLYADHEAVHHKGAEPFVSHYNNQYDFIYGAGLHFLRSGDSRWRELMVDAARHTIDVDIYHTQEDKAAFSGGLFWHTDHYQPAATCTHRTYSAANSNGRSYGGGPSNEHNYTSGLLQYYYLTGDPEAASAVRELADWVVAMDDGSRNLFGLIDDGPTGTASKSRDQDFHKPGRGAGNSINALLDAYAVTGERRYLHKAEELIQRVIHPADELSGLGLDQPETRWSYIVFLQVLGRYLDRKLELGEGDYLFWYARASLLHYSRWMMQHERPYKDVLHKVELPTETWPAHDIRKCHVFHIAARFARDEERAEFSRQAAYYFERCIADLLSFPTAYVTRPQVILCVYGGIHGYFLRHPDAAELPAERAYDFGDPIPFTTQRARLGGTLRRKLLAVRSDVGRLIAERWHRLWRRTDAR